MTLNCPQCGSECNIPEGANRDLQACGQCYCSLSVAECNRRRDIKAEIVERRKAEQADRERRREEARRILQG